MRIEEKVKKEALITTHLKCDVCGKISLINETDDWINIEEHIEYSWESFFEHYDICCAKCYVEQLKRCLEDNASAVREDRLFIDEKRPSFVIELLDLLNIKYAHPED
jgi:hypothetical protein